MDDLDGFQDSEDIPDFSPRSDGAPGDPADAEPNGDEEMGAWIEWTSMRGSQKGGSNFTAGEEDDEESDPSGQCDEDGVNTAFAMAFSTAPGCSICDPDHSVDDQRCDDIDMDREPDDGF
jgi:hypothetical protein